MSTKTKSKITTFLPDHLANATPAIAAAGRELAEAMEAVSAAREGDRAAQAAVDAAPGEDKRLMREAVAQGEDSPPRTEAVRKGEADAARRRLDAANTNASAAAHRLRVALVENRDQLDAIVAPRVKSAAGEVLSALDALGSAFDGLASEVGIRRGIFAATTDRSTTAAEERSRAMSRTPRPNIPSFQPVANLGAELASMRATVEKLTTQPTPAHDPSIERRKVRAEREARAAELRAELQAKGAAA